MLNVGRIEEGFVLDHIKAGKSMTIYHDLKLDKLDCCVAIIKNARSNKMGKKDIIKVECNVDMLVMPCSIHGNFRLSIPELKKIKKFYEFWRKWSITQLNIKWDGAMIN